jgi:hypothetical protein
MKRLLVIVGLLSLALVGCAPRAPASLPTIEATSSPDEATPTHIPLDLTPAQRAAITSLSGTLGLAADQISVISTEGVDWPDGCLGVVRMGVMCTQGIVAGFRVVLEADGQRYEFHTNQDGSVIVPVEGLPVSGSAQEAMITQLSANLGMAKEDIRLVSSSPVQWQDGCLGVALEGVMCPDGVVTGYLIVLEAGGRQFEYHTNGNGSRMMPATWAMGWKQQGGIAGLCQGLTVYLSGEVYGIKCTTESDGRMAILTTAERTQLYSWVDQYGMTSIDLSDPRGVADGMSRLMDLAGKGTQQPSREVQQTLFAWSQALYQRLYH